MPLLDQVELPSLRFESEETDLSHSYTLQVRDYVRSLAEGEIATSITEIQGFRTNIQKMVDKVENLYHPISHSLSRLVRWVLRLRS